MPRSSYYQIHRPRRKRPKIVRKAHPRALTAREQEVVRAWLNSERFADCAPRTIYATLLDEGTHLCHWSTMYRLLRTDAATRERRAIRRHPVYAKPELLATAPRQVWSWDITMLRGPRAGLWYRLYTLIDIFSRMVVGWLVAEHEDALLAERLIADACTREGIGDQQLTIHADRGAVMQSHTLAILMEDLGVRKSHSRPSVSNDNPYSEAQFKTMKYGPTYPDRFGSLAEAETWVQTFVTWYNTEHRHSGIGFLTPQMHHAGQAIPITAARQATLDAAYDAHPERFPHGRPHPPVVPDQAGINLPLSTPDDLATPPAMDVCSAHPITDPLPADALGSRVSAAAAAP
jgi:transposase InsO family protein